MGSIGRSNKHRMRQIKRQLNIMVAKGIVLFGIQHFQQRCRRVSPKIHAHFVDFIKQNTGFLELA